jgi:ubiquinone/menaquinone biosynthesis C-methylase UbiE
MTLPNYAMSRANFPEMYEQWLVGPLFRPWAEMTLDEVQLSSGHRVLDIACGTGIVARVAKERMGAAGHVVGVDISSDMLAVARAVAPSIDWREGNASALPLHRGEQFDIVVCQQGLQFFPDKPAAAAEMRRALARGGRLAVSTWRSDEEIPLFRELRRVAERHLGAVADQRYGFGDAAALQSVLQDAGFGEVQVRTVRRSIRFDHGEPFLRLNAMAYVGMSAA